MRHAVATIDGKELPVMQAVKDDDWLKGDFIKTIQCRGAAIIKARKLSSAMSASKAICDHMKDWWFGTKTVSYEFMNWIDMDISVLLGMNLLLGTFVFEDHVFWLLFKRDGIHDGLSVYWSVVVYYVLV